MSGIWCLIIYCNLAKHCSFSKLTHCTGLSVDSMLLYLNWDTQLLCADLWRDEIVTRTNEHSSRLKTSTVKESIVRRPLPGRDEQQCGDRRPRKISEIQLWAKRLPLPVNDTCDLSWEDKSFRELPSNQCLECPLPMSYQLNSNAKQLNHRVLAIWQQV